MGSLQGYSSTSHREEAPSGPANNCNYFFPFDQWGTIWSEYKRGFSSPLHWILCETVAQQFKNKLSQCSIVVKLGISQGIKAALNGQDRQMKDVTTTSEGLTTVSKHYLSKHQQIHPDSTIRATCQQHWPDHKNVLYGLTSPHYYPESSAIVSFRLKRNYHSSFFFLPELYLKASLWWYVLNH